MPAVKVFLDTNVWLSAIVFPGLCAELLVALHDGEHELLTTGLVRQETHAVLQRKFARHTQAVLRFDLLWARATCVPDVAEPAEDADARLVAAAEQAGAELFITGDQRVLAWEPFAGMRVVGPREAWGVIMAGR